MKIRLLIAFVLMFVLGEVSSISAQTDSRTGKVLVVYYSRTGENYGVGNIKEGNTAIIAKMIAEETGADIFEIQTKKDYPDDYTRCTEVAREEKNSNARPETVGDIDTDMYVTVYIGYPVWWGDAPMAVYTFIDGHNWNGKTVIPFCTHEGSGLSGINEIASACKGSQLKSGLSVKGTVAQNERDKARRIVRNWLNKNKI